MTETLCGPSNPLQNFQKHTSSDRSLQQDRLSSRHNHVSQGFRSQASGRAGLLDPEFEAFQAGASLATADPYEFQPRPMPAQHFGPSFYQESPASGAWAADFAKLHISQPPPAPFQQAPPRQAHHGASWHQDFRSQIDQSPTQAPSSFSHSQTLMGGPMSSFNAQTPFGYVPSAIQNEPQSVAERWKGKARWQREETHDTEAFEREFEAMATEALRTTGPATELGQDETISAEGQQSSKDRFVGLDETNQTDFAISERDYAQSLHRDAQVDATPYDPKVALREDPVTQDANQRNPIEADEELAKTAGVLLEHVSDNTTEKFQQSSFLALMRQFRDHEKRIDGNKVVDADLNAQTPGLIPPQHQDTDMNRNGPDKYSMTGALSPDWPSNNGYMGPGGHAVNDFASSSAAPPGETSHQH